MTRADGSPFAGVVEVETCAGGDQDDPRGRRAVASVAVTRAVGARSYPRVEALETCADGGPKQKAAPIGAADQYPQADRRRCNPVSPDFGRNHLERQPPYLAYNRP
ncbi:MAG: hypothetical protein E3J21_07915 [Anaerolineales bacterium]|nr:MAG: hypothetical protein E3J21_07915 [Anaerolineales bacterium]